MDFRTYGYARVSSSDQNLDRQIKALIEYGVLEDRIIMDKRSGKDLEREGYNYLKKTVLRDGDTLVIKSLDRLSRRKEDIKSELEYYRKHNIRVRILDLPTTLTDFDGQDWIFDMVNNIIIEVLGSIAEQERNNIKMRQREGIDAALEKGTVFGRQKISVGPEEFIPIYDKWKQKELTAVEAMQKLGMKRSTFYRRVKEYESTKTGKP